MVQQILVWRWEVRSGVSATSGADGSDVVILRMTTADYSGVSTGSPTVILRRFRYNFSF